jgi:hypothetical protein
MQERSSKAGEPISAICSPSFADRSVHLCRYTTTSPFPLSLLSSKTVPPGGSSGPGCTGELVVFRGSFTATSRSAGPTGLEEYLGCGFGIALTVSADTQALHFHSDHYFVARGAVRLRLPRWLEPGALTISHIERDDGWFAFVLTPTPPAVWRDHPPNGPVPRTLRSKW